MSKRTKSVMIKHIQDRIGNTQEILVVDSSKMDANTTNTWRLDLQKQEISAFTVKNSLARLALHEFGITGLDPFLEGPSTLIWGGEDVVSLTKLITKNAKAIKELEIKGATVEGASLDSDSVTKLSKSPGREELLSMIAGQILSPGAKLAGALLGPGSTLAGQIKSKAEEDEA